MPEEKIGAAMGAGWALNNQKYYKDAAARIRLQEQPEVGEFEQKLYEFFRRITGRRRPGGHTGITPGEFRKSLSRG